MQVKKQTIEIDVFVLEESDLDGFDDRARATGRMEPLRLDLQDKIQKALGKPNIGVQVGFRNGAKNRRITYVNVGNVSKLEAGQAIAMLPTGMAKIDVPDPKPAKKAAVKKAAAKKEDDGSTDESD